MEAKILSSFGEPAVSIATEMPELCFFVFVFQLVLAHLSPYFPFALFPLPPLFFQACMPPRIRPEGLTFYCHVLPLLFPSHERPSVKKPFLFAAAASFSFSLSPSVHNFPPPSPCPLSQLEMGALHRFRRWLFSRVYSQGDKNASTRFPKYTGVIPFHFLSIV